MKKNTVALVLLVLIIGFGSGYLLGGREPDIGAHIMPNGATMEDERMSMGNAMQNMMAGLEQKTGDEFDKAFLSEMITHHQGAVEMAESALVNAKHEEIKEMAHAILTAQTAEIGQMQVWQKSWYAQ